MTIHQGPRPVGTPKAEAINHYAHRAYEFEDLITANGTPERFGVILQSAYFVEIDPVAILDAAGKAEMENPDPKCAAPMGPYHCVKRWHHAGDHLHI